MKFPERSKAILEKEDDLILARFKEENPWGLSMSVDLYDCDLALMKDEKKIREFVKTLIKRLDMKAYGDTLVVNFGEDPRVSGFSMFQLIETSGIAGHFANNSKAIYLDIFSCKDYRPHEAAAFCKSFFKAKEMHVQIAFRH
jgi:S-adenosylmethionine/arginine decarboxylase-like enzyme